MFDDAIFDSVIFDTGEVIVVTPVGGSVGMYKQRYEYDQWIHKNEEEIILLMAAWLE